MKSDEDQVRQLLANYAEALNTGDANGAFAAYASGGQLIPNNMAILDGERLLNFYQQLFRTVRLSVTFEIHEVAADGDLAYARTSTRNTDDASTPAQNRELFVFVRQAGDWKIHRYMFNQPAAPEDPNT